MHRSKILVLFALLLLIGGAVGVNFLLSPKVPEPKFPFPTEEISYTYWRPDDGANTVIRQALDDYEKAHPNVKVELKTFPPEEYQQVITTALSFRNPPNLFHLDAAELTGLRNRLAPAPALTYAPSEFMRDFHPSAHPAVVSGALYGVPLRVLPFVLLANEQEFKDVGVDVPTIWASFVDAAPKMRESEGVDLKKGAIALGTANLLHEPEILSLLILQNGGNILSADLSSAVFAEPAGGFNPGAEALKFFGTFADPGKSTYSYNSFQPKALTAFEEGEISSFIGTQENERTLASGKRKPAVYPLPQISTEKSRSMMRLPLEGIHANSDHPQVAWDILQYLASERIQKRIYLETGILAPREEVLTGAKKDAKNAVYIAELEKGQILVKVSSGKYDSMMRRIVTRYFSGENPQFVLDSEQKSFTEFLMERVASDT